MAEDQAPEIVLEFKGGWMTIRTPEAVYEVKVTTLGEGARVLPPSGRQPSLPGFPEPAEPKGAQGLLPPAAEPSRGRRSEEYFGEISHDFFRELGSLARRLASSLAKLARAEESPGGSTGLPREMDEALAKARQIVGQLRASQEAERQAAQARRKLAAALAAAAGAKGPSLKPLAQRAAALAKELSAAQGEAAAISGDLDLDRVMEAVYEHCANQTVRKHIRAMWEDRDAFDPARLDRALAALAPSAARRGDELIFPLIPALQALQDSTGHDRYRQILAKMQGTAEQIFPDLDLPVQAAGEGPAGPAPPPELLARVVRLLEQVGQAAAAAGPKPPAELIEAAQEPAEDLDQAQQLGQLERSLQGLQDMVAGLGPGLEGRRDRQMLRLLGDLLLQMLALLVSAGAKLQARETQPDLNNFQAEQLAQEQVEAALAKLAPPEDAAGDKPALPEIKKVEALLESLGV